MNKKLHLEIDRRTKAENSMRRAVADAQEANRLKSEFLANISHEIRTPLNAVIGFSELLKQMTIDKIQSQYIYSIKSAGKTLLNLINDILDLSKMEAGKMKIHYDSIDAKAILEEIKYMFELKVKEKGLDFIIELDDDFPRFFSFDETRVRQILINLIGNAIKFTENGFIKLGLKVIRIDSVSFDAEISVTDTGRGIEKDQVNEIFHSFQQNNHQTKNKYGGTGLGLAITKKLVELMEGKISLESEVYKGSLFKIIFKNIIISKVDNHPITERFFNTRNIYFPNKKVLVVEDIDSNSEIITKILTQVDIMVMNAVNGEEALIMLENNVPDLILMDIRMPVMDGITATKTIKSKSKLKGVPVIAQTAAVEHYTKDQLANIFDDVIFKPIEKSKLINLLSKYMQYQEKEEKSDSTSTQKSEDSLEKIKHDNELTKFLKETMIEQIPTLLAYMLIDDIQSFSNKLQELSIQYKNDILEKFCDNLLEDIQFFDIEKIQKKLNYFYNIFKEE